MKKTPLRNVVLITWVDSNSGAGWEYGEVDNELKPIHSIGFLVACDKKAVTITTSLTNSLRGKLDPLTIPYGAILKIIKIPIHDKQFSDTGQQRGQAI